MTDREISEYRKLYPEFFELFKVEQIVDITIITFDGSGNKNFQFFVKDKDFKKGINFTAMENVFGYTDYILCAPSPEYIELYNNGEKLIPFMKHFFNKEKPTLTMSGPDAFSLCPVSGF